MSAPQPSTTLIERIMPVAVLFVVILIVLFTILPFVPAILWGVMLAITAEPRYQWLVAKLDGRRTTAAVISCIALLLVFVIPALGLARALLAFLPEALSWLERISVVGHYGPLGELEAVPGIGPHLVELWQAVFEDAYGTASHFQEELKAVLIWGLHELEIFGVFVFEFAVGVIMAVILMHRSERVADLSRKFCHRVAGNFGERIGVLSVTTTRQAVRGVLGAALAQTLVAAFSFYIADVPGWIVWSGLTFIMALVQVGPILIAIPIALWLYTTGAVGMAAFVFLWSITVVSLVDNFVRPLLVSKDSSLPAFLAFLGAIGGLFQWGIVGVFLGPVIMAVGYEILLKWIEPETLPDLERVDPTELGKTPDQSP